MDFALMTDGNILNYLLSANEKMNGRTSAIYSTFNMKSVNRALIGHYVELVS